MPLLANADQFPELARWTQVVAAGDFTDGVAAYRLPFQALHPDFNVDLGSLGLVHARLSVPGQGVFEATTGATPIRQFNPVRDRLQQQVGQRFWPIERTDRPKTYPPAYFSGTAGNVLMACRAKGRPISARFFHRQAVQHKHGTA